MIVKLYGGRVEIAFNPDSKIQRYSITVDGQKIKASSVTTIGGIKDKSAALVSWATDLMRDALLDKCPNISEEDIFAAHVLHRERKEEAGNVGTKTHEWLEHHIKSLMGQGEHPDMPDDPAVEIGVNAWLEFEDAHKIKYLSVERPIYSLAHGYVGRMDIEAIVDKKHALLDLKTSNGLYNGVRMQTAAYLKADEEERGKQIYKTRWAIRVAKETEEEYLKRMERKKKITFDPYVAFEAKEFADGLDRDFEAFLAAQNLFEWDNATDFWKLANAKT